MTPQELKNSILWNAIQGKLTQQKKEESAQQIVPISLMELDVQNETYFEIPDNWCWCKIGKIFKLVNGKAFKPTDWSEKGLPIVRIQNLNDIDAPYNYFEGDIENKYILTGGELLFSWSGTPGTSFGAYIWKGSKAVLNQHIFIVYPKIDLDYQYAKYALNGEIKVFIEKAHGGAGLKHITKKDFEGCLIPIPPIEKQKRIVEKIEELLPYIDQYEKAWNKLEQFNKRFPEDMKKSLLQYAIEGKLVEQRPEEGTAEELFKKIQEEKQRLIREKKIKKEKPLPEITEEEKPFDIPESWKWVRLGNITSKLTDGSHNPPPNTGMGYPVISAKNVKSGLITFENVDRFTDNEGFEKENPRTNIIKGDIIMGIIGGSIGNVAIYTHDIKVIAQRSIAIMRFLISIDFSKILLESPLIQNKLMISTSGSAQGGVYLGTLKNLTIPLPPLAEQKRIVEKLEQLLPLCDRLK